MTKLDIRKKNVKEIRKLEGRISELSLKIPQSAESGLDHDRNKLLLEKRKLIDNLDSSKERLLEDIKLNGKNRIDKTNKVIGYYKNLSLNLKFSDDHEDQDGEAEGEGEDIDVELDPHHLNQEVLDYGEIGDRPTQEGDHRMESTNPRRDRETSVRKLEGVNQHSLNSDADHNADDNRIFYANTQTQNKESRGYLNRAFDED
mmetsp:Transcript_99157/g.214014  ORF Transcript_99157/g.214014 Transcript_99157/m.214014 type:complete len:202 (+) Transcript_99157:260-865(+)|eukprot:CAMPEP_0116933128 /NCGR_PEP_ID=MMETSP0467-20121206/28843_1 /TAXON_ID=283647 /ORGANISM="Mesodinium pulex, Strain SPMC105" /LENGTH=201 /DNA_ID=CAMNT_0004613931 /DNA_START=1789 /DNA_END=2394 /DNA_ORIENTATION=+